MQVLITGSRGRIGEVVTSLAYAEGHQVRSFDRVASGPLEWEHIPGDVTDAAAVRRAMMGCDAVIHLAAIPNDRAGMADVIVNTNLTGTWNVLEAAAEAQVRKVVFFSSAQALGIWAGRRGPDYLPVDDAHPHYAVPAYGLSKHLGEEMCASFTRSHHLSTYCLRPVYVVVGEQRDWRRYRNTAWAQTWLVGEYYSYVDVRDVARAAVLCLQHAGEAHHGRYLLAAENNIMGWNTADILKEDYPEIPWVAPPEYLNRPDRGFVNTAAALNDLGWRAQHEMQPPSTEGT